MPVNTIHAYLKSILDGLVIPGTAGTLEAFICPPVIRTEPPPVIFIWSSRGNESRQSVPRAAAPNQPLGQSGWKSLDHTVDAYLTWFDDNTDASLDSAFPAVLDAVMQTLRSSADPVYFLTDSLTGQQSELYGIGEKLSYELAPVRSTADQRYLRFDALITIHVGETFQA